MLSQYTYKNAAAVEADKADPVILKVLPKEALVTVESYSSKVENSIKRLYPAARVVRRQHVYDALNILQGIHTKAAE